MSFLQPQRPKCLRLQKNTGRIAELDSIYSNYYYVRRDILSLRSRSMTNRCGHMFASTVQSARHQVSFRNADLIGQQVQVVLIEMDHTLLFYSKYCLCFFSIPQRALNCLCSVYQSGNLGHALAIARLRRIGLDFGLIILLLTNAI